MLDGRSTASTHYIGLMAIFGARAQVDTQASLSYFLLWRMKRLNAPISTKLYWNMYWVFTEKGVNNVFAVISDNCATNRALYGLFSCGFVGCASQKFNLAVKDLLMTHKDIICKVRELMKKLRALLERAILRKFTDLTPIVSSVTRWSSTYEMLQRYLRLRDVLIQIQISDIDDMMPIRRETQDLESLCSKLGVLESVTKRSNPHPRGEGFALSYE
eukprot:IDg12778t1